ncbi:MAG: HAD hydrolase-like protein [Clostridiales bacterium]|nr:HAD hydrolase-like protein [Clostridiales bacterium]
MKKIVIFDMDGTLIDSAPGILNCLRYSLEKMGEPQVPRETGFRFIGPPLMDSYKEFCGFDDEKARRALTFYRERYRGPGRNECEAVPGIIEVLRHLKEQGFRLAVASTKPVEHCAAIAENLGMAPYFEVICGSSESLTDKAAVMGDALRRMEVGDPHTAIMVGDRKFDVEGAAQCGMDCVGVDFCGFAEPGELEAAGAVAVVHSAAELENWLLR